MRLIRFLIYFATILATVGGCPRIDNIEDFNDRPAIVFNQMEGISWFEDSIKISLKNSQKSYDIVLRTTDINQNIAFLSYKLLTGHGTLFQNGIPIEENFINLNLENNSVVLSYEPAEPGLHTVEFTLKDDFDETATFTLQLEAFINLIPVADFRVRRPENPIDPLERLIDASESFDQDKKFGGGITGYEYTFLGKTIQVEDSSIPVIFPSADNYDISVRVMDNDSQLSELVTINTKIE